MTLAGFLKTPKIIALFGVAASLLLYYLGVKFFIFPVLLIYLVFFVRYPDIFTSVLSRLFVSIFIFYAIFQIVTLIGLVLFRGAGFDLLLTLTVFFIALSSLLFPPPDKASGAKSPFASKVDYAIFGVVLVVLIIPLAAYFFSGDGFRMAEIGSLQGVDGANHFKSIMDYRHDEALLYQKGNYYPASFHLTTSFLLDSMGLLGQGWISGAYLYFILYLIFIFTMAVSLMYMVAGLVGLGRKKLSWKIVLGAALILLPATLVFYILPFIYAGFLTYFFIIACMALAFMYLIPSKNNDNLTSSLTFYYLLASAAAIAWPLFVPVLLLVPFIVSSLNDGIKLLQKKWKLLLSGSLLLSAPYVVQVYYSDTNATDSINLDGGLKVFHASLYFVAIAFVGYLTTNAKLPEKYKSFVLKISFPLIVLFASIVAYQYFTIGDIRYYGIKVGMSLMIFIFVIATSYVLLSMRGNTITSILVALSFIPLTTFMLIAVNDNPLASMRSIARTQSGEQKPPQFDQDVATMIKLGQQGKLEKNVVLTLHYDSVQGKYYAHPQTAFWGNLMSYRVDEKRSFLACYQQVYDELLFGNYTDESQKKLLQQVGSCVKIADLNNQGVIVITDVDSVQSLEKLFKEEQVTIMSN